MIKLNYIIVLSILFLIALLYINNSEHFAGALTQTNAEAVANISSMVNSGNMTVSNITASESLNAPKNLNAKNANISDNLTVKNVNISDKLTTKNLETKNIKLYGDLDIGTISESTIHNGEINSDNMLPPSGGNISTIGNISIGGKLNVNDANIDGKISSKNNGFELIKMIIPPNYDGTLKNTKGDVYKVADYVCIITGNIDKTLVFGIKGDSYHIKNTFWMPSSIFLLSIPKNYFSYTYGENDVYELKK